MQNQGGGGQKCLIFCTSFYWELTTDDDGLVKLVLCLVLGRDELLDEMGNVVGRI